MRELVKKYLDSLEDDGKSEKTIIVTSALLINLSNGLKTQMETVILKMWLVVMLKTIRHIVTIRGANRYG